MLNKPPRTRSLPTLLELPLNSRVPCRPFESIPIPDISRYLLEWLENWQQALADRRLMKSGMIIDYPVVKRFYELDALRGLAIGMMLIKHGMDGWGCRLAADAGTGAVGILGAA